MIFIEPSFDFSVFSCVFFEVRSESRLKSVFDLDYLRVIDLLILCFFLSFAWDSSGPRLSPYSIIFQS